MCVYYMFISMCWYNILAFHLQVVQFSKADCVCGGGISCLCVCVGIFFIYRWYGSDWVIVCVWGASLLCVCIDFITLLYCFMGLTVCVCGGGGYECVCVLVISYYLICRWYGFMGLTGLIGIMVLFQLLGLACGVFGTHKDALPTERGCLSNTGGNCLMA